MPFQVSTKTKDCDCGTSYTVASIKCYRTEPVDVQIQAIAKKALDGSFYELMKRGEHYQTGDLGVGANYYRAKRECSCALDRILNPKIRDYFEQTVLDMAMKSIYAQEIANPTKPFFLNVAFGCSGDLLGEQVTLFRLLDQLKGKAGILRVSLIDLDYKGSIAKIKQSAKTVFAHQMDPKTEAIKEFVNDSRAVMPKDILLEVNVYGDFHDYANDCARNPKYKYDVLVGSDIAGEDDLFFKVKDVAAKPTGGLALLDKVEAEYPNMVRPVIIEDDRRRYLSAIPDKYPV